MVAIEEGLPPSRARRKKKDSNISRMSLKHNDDEHDGVVIVETVAQNDEDTDQDHDDNDNNPSPTIAGHQ